MKFATCSIDLFESIVTQVQRSEVPTTAGVNPFLSTNFLLPAIKHFGGSGTKLLVGYQAGEPALVVPVHASKVGAWRTFAPSQLPITPLIVTGDNSQLPMLSAWMVAGKHPPLLSLDILHYDEQYLPAISGDQSTIDSQWYCDTMSISCNDGFSTYWSERSKKLRDNISRYRKRTERDGLDLRLRHCRAPTEVQEALKRYSAIETAGWKGRAGTAIDMASTQGEFYAEVLGNFARANGAHIFELLFDNKVVSSRIGIQSGQTIAFLKTTYDETFSRYAPGRLLLFETINRLFQEGGVKCLEFYTKANADQAQWATDLRPIRHVRVFRRKWLCSQYRAGRRIKKSFGLVKDAVVTRLKSDEVVN